MYYLIDCYFYTFWIEESELNKYNVDKGNMVTAIAPSSRMRHQESSWNFCAPRVGQMTDSVPQTSVPRGPPAIMPLTTDGKDTVSLAQSIMTCTCS